MESTRQKRVAKLVQKELGDIFLKESKSMFAGKMITVTQVRMSPDLSLARVYLSVFPAVTKEEFHSLVDEQKKKIRFELSRRIHNQLRSMPELAFFLDDSLDYIERIDKLLE
ncbi:MAG: 30S ribosome-binding factor RbfA [Bacteroidales bacterium]|nr:30S ribosome-binding factor RbfA [Bacteroidales bacterium]